jgi:hypothetical protein
MEILNHYINTANPRTFYSMYMAIHAGHTRRGSHWMPTHEYKTLESALRQGLIWLDRCDEERSQAEFRVMKVRVYPDGSVRFWPENEWHASIKYLEFLDYSEDMIVRALTLREEALKGLAA